MMLWVGMLSVYLLSFLSELSLSQGCLDNMQWKEQQTHFLSRCGINAHDVRFTNVSPNSHTCHREQ